MAIFKCKMCGGSLDINANETVAICEYCGTKQTIPKLDDEKRVQLYDRANHFRRANEFDKAMGIYEMILGDDKEDAEAYWGIVLCRYGIEYVEDPTTHNRIPTVNRAQFVSIFEDSDYMSAIKYADGYQREVYQNEAAAIDKLQKGILEISSKEEPFDVFICYKETDKNGDRTYDSVLAEDIYTELTKEGYNVFFSRITLEDKLGTAYEPYIFAALNSAKVMLVVGTNREHFDAVWVKNEWSRYLSLVKNGKDKKSLIPVYKDISPYDLPEEMAYLQSQDANKIGFMQDLVRGIKKLLGGNQTTTRETVVVKEAAPQIPTEELDAGQALLEQGNFEEAMKHFENQSKIDPYGWKAYWGMFKCAIKAKTDDDIYFPGFLSERRKSERGESNIGFIEYYKSAKSKAYLVRSNEINFDNIEFEYKKADALQQQYKENYTTLKSSYENKSFNNIPSEKGKETAKKYWNVCQDFNEVYEDLSRKKIKFMFFIFGIVAAMSAYDIYAIGFQPDGGFGGYMLLIFPVAFGILLGSIVPVLKIAAGIGGIILGCIGIASLTIVYTLFGIEFMVLLFAIFAILSFVFGFISIIRRISLKKRSEMITQERNRLRQETANAFAEDACLIGASPEYMHYHIRKVKEHVFDYGNYEIQKVEQINLSDFGYFN